MRTPWQLPQASMKPHGNLSGKSGVIAYEIHPDAIVVRFKNGKRYRYTTASAGAAAIATMRALAATGEGLSTFIAQHDPAYEEELA